VTVSANSKVVMRQDADDIQHGQLVLMSDLVIKLGYSKL